MKKLQKFIATLPTLLILSISGVASAHVVVEPAQANVGESVTFTINVPNEKDVDVTNLKLVIPTGLQEVTPTVKNGWTITTEKTGEGESATVTSITWADGTIPAGFRDDFTFSAQVPAKAGDLAWKAYQTYADGTVVHWDQKPAGSDDANGNAGPYSVTSVVNDLASKPAETTTKSNNTAALAISLVALIVSIGTVLFRGKK